MITETPIGKLHKCALECILFSVLSLAYDAIKLKERRICQSSLKISCSLV